MPKVIRYHRSPQREAILELVISRRSHHSAEEIYAALRPRHPRLSMGTVYRNLHILVAQGRLQVLHFGSGQDLYDARLDVHGHLLCRGCGGLWDLELPALEEIHKLGREQARGFTVECCALVFRGFCDNCRVSPADGA